MTSAARLACVWRWGQERVARGGVRPRRPAGAGRRGGLRQDGRQGLVEFMGDAGGHFTQGAGSGASGAHARTLSLPAAAWARERRQAAAPATSKAEAGQRPGQPGRPRPGGGRQAALAAHLEGLAGRAQRLLQRQAPVARRIAGPLGPAAAQRGWRPPDSAGMASPGGNAAGGTSWRASRSRPSLEGAKPASSASSTAAASPGGPERGRRPDGVRQAGRAPPRAATPGAVRRCGSSAQQLRHGGPQAGIQAFGRVDGIGRPAWPARLHAAPFSGSACAAPRWCSG